LGDRIGGGVALADDEIDSLGARSCALGFQASYCGLSARGVDLRPFSSRALVAALPIESRRRHHGCEDSAENDEQPRPHCGNPSR
jgi:hypothetical protein